MSSPGTSFQSETRAAPSPRASSVAVRSEPPRPRVATSPSGVAPMKPGTTGTTPRARSGAEEPLDRAIGAGQIRRRLAEGAVGMDDLERIHVPGRVPRASSAAATRRALSALAAGDQIVGGAGRQLAEEAEALGQRLELLEDLADVGQHVGPEPAGGQQGPRDLGVPGAQPGDEGSDGARLAAPGLLRHGQERIGRARHGGDHHDGGLLAVAADDLDGMADGGGIGQRRTAELVHVWRPAGTWHGGK